jgi:hypothetical protein
VIPEARASTSFIAAFPSASGSSMTVAGGAPVADVLGAHGQVEADCVRVAFDQQGFEPVREGRFQRVVEERPPEPAADRARVEPEIRELTLRRMTDDAVEAVGSPSSSSTQIAAVSNSPAVNVSESRTA